MTKQTQISSNQADWSREKPLSGRYEPWKNLLISIRRYQKLEEKGGFFFRLLARKNVMKHRFWSAVCGADIPINSQLGGGLIMPHPTGIVIHPDAVIGPNCLIFQQVTIGTGPLPGVPEIGGHVDIGAGAKILGGIRIGDHSRIGANAVVVKDVPYGATVAGIPARITSIRKDFKNE